MKTNQPHRPTVAHLLGLLAHHVRSFHETPAGRKHTSGIHFDGVEALVTVEITPRRFSDDPVWDQCTVNGRWEGNRCGAEQAIARIYAPVIAAAATYWAAAPADPDRCAICHDGTDGYATFDVDGAGLCEPCAATEAA